MHVEVVYFHDSSKPSLTQSLLCVTFSVVFRDVGSYVVAVYVDSCENLSSGN